MVHILIAPNAFKNSLSATTAAEAIKEGLLRSDLDCDCVCFPIADGGDGTGELIINKFRGARFNEQVHDPLGKIINAPYGIINNDTGVIEMASASGLALLKIDALDPLHATTFGTGELIKVALDMGMRKIILAMGGSATVDGGCGILLALGARFLDSDKKDLEYLPESLIDLAHIDLLGLDQRILETELTVLCDVDNKLLGAYGAAAVFGPQKGATETGIKKLEAALLNFNKITMQQFGTDMSAIEYSGTAGGAAAGLGSFLNARLVKGIDYILDQFAFEKALEKADIVITGEGSIDEQTLRGKGPFGVAARAKAKGLRVIALAGKVPLHESDKLKNYFDVLMSIGHEPSNMEAACQSALNNLTRTAKEIGNLLAIPNGR